MSTNQPKQVSKEIYESILNTIELMREHYFDAPEYGPMIIKLKSVARELNDIRVREVCNMKAETKTQ